MTLSISTLAIGHPGSRLYADIGLAAPAGSFTCVLGRNGAGKTTLLRSVSGLLRPQAGMVVLDGTDIHRMSAPERARRIAVVLTERPAAPGLTVHDVVALGRQPFTGWFGRLTAADSQIVEEALQDVGAFPLLERQYMTLSDGERQRVLIARALAQQPSLLVLDEVTAFLDLPGRVEMMSLLRSVAVQRQIVVLLSSHDLDLAIQFADHLWVLQSGGTIAAGMPEDVVLAGAISQGFDSPLARYSVQRAVFEMVAQQAGPRIAVTGEEPARYWTERALRRAGYVPVTVADADVNARLQVACNPLLLKVRIGTIENSVHSIEGALALLATASV